MKRIVPVGSSARDTRIQRRGEQEVDEEGGVRGAALRREEDV
jgi:hypothetical protein